MGHFYEDGNSMARPSHLTEQKRENSMYRYESNRTIHGDPTDACAAFSVQRSTAQMAFVNIYMLSIDLLASAIFQNNYYIFPSLS